jgi:agmatinase
MRLSAAILSCAAVAIAHGDHDQDQEPMYGPHEGLWYNTLPGDGGTQVRTASYPKVSHEPCQLTGIQADSVFSGISTFGRLRYHPCLSSRDVKYDIAFIGAPFDTGTSYRPGARFGPSGIRQGSRRLNL